jgi:hypothetical protein
VTGVQTCALPIYLLSSFLLVFIIVLGIFAASCDNPSGGGGSAPNPTPSPTPSGPKPTPTPSSSAKVITSFKVAGETGIIAAQTITVTVPQGTALTGLTPDDIIISAKADISPKKDVAQNFFTAAGFSPVTYTVTAEDGSKADWTVTVKWAPLALASSNIATGIGNYFTPPLPDNTGDGSNVNNPIILPVDIDLASGGWTTLLGAIQTANKYVALDLSDCDMTGTEFDPESGTSNNNGKDKIVSLILPDKAESIAAGTSSAYTFQNFTNLKSVSGKAKEIGVYAFPYCALETVSLPEAQSIGDYVFYGCSQLTEVSLPKVETIGNFAFAGCVLLGTVNFPEAQSIGDSAFGYIGTGDLTITLGSTAPKLGTILFTGVSGGTKNVTVKVPSGATGYGSSPTDDSTDNWGNAFRGKGWDGASYQGGAVNPDIKLTIA